MAKKRAKLTNFISKCRQMLLSRLDWFVTNYFNVFLVAIDSRDTALPCPDIDYR